MRVFLIIATVLYSYLLIGCYSYDSYYNGTSTNGGSSYLSGFQQPHNGLAPITHKVQAAAQGYWDGDGITGIPKIRISLDDQRAYYFKGETLVGVSPISTGTDGHGTPRGRYKVTQKEVDHNSSLYGIIKNEATGQTIVNDADTRKDKIGKGEIFVHAPMPYFMRFNGAIGMHAGFLPGYPASHGCVRMPNNMAQKFYDNTPYGTIVIVE